MKQGSVLSPFLFAIMSMTSVLCVNQDSIYRLDIIVYADDILLLTVTVLVSMPTVWKRQDE